MKHAEHRFDPPLSPGRLVKRYKRFFADVVLDDGREVVAHCGNTGRMQGLLEPDSRVWVKHHDDPKRKLKWSWQIASEGETQVGINTQLPNALVAEAIALEQIPELRGYTSVRREVRYGTGSRIDMLLEGHPEDPRACYVEVKNVTLIDGSIARFPDAVTSRGLKHLGELTTMVNSGSRAMMCYLIQRGDAASFEPAETIDPAYALGLRDAMSKGVEAVAWVCEVTSTSIRVSHAVPVSLTSTA
jgi:sugar fermentation stimulation protein A